MLFSGADINRWDLDGVTPLMIAAIEGHAEAVRTLIRLEARMEILDQDDKSVLFHAAEKDLPEILKVLPKRPFHSRTLNLLLSGMKSTKPHF